MKRLILAVAFLIGAVPGCRGGLPLLSQANPQTTLRVTPHVTSQTIDIDFFSNDGRAMTCDKLSYVGKDGKQLNVEKLVITERSVENRTANVPQIEAGGIAASNFARAVGSAFAENVTAAAPIVENLARYKAMTEVNKAMQPSQWAQIAGALGSGQLNPAGVKSLLGADFEAFAAKFPQLNLNPPPVTTRTTTQP